MTRKSSVLDSSIRDELSTMPGRTGGSMAILRRVHILIDQRGCGNAGHFAPP